MSDRMNVQVGPGKADDLTALTAIYNHYVRETPITFDVTSLTPDERRQWLLSHPEDGPHRLLVARIPGPDGRVLGYATSGPFRQKATYATSVETSIYPAPDAGGRGIGTLLHKELFEQLATEDVHRAYAGITLRMTRRCASMSVSASAGSGCSRRSGGSSPRTTTWRGTRSG